MDAPIHRAAVLLVSAGRLDLHRRLEVLGAALAGAMVLLYLSRWTLLQEVSRLLVHLSIPSPSTRFQFFETAVFCVLIVWALRARLDGPAHKRLILIATVSLMGPAVSRWPLVPIAHTGLWISAILVSFIFLAAGFDLWS
jgi:hypothetical protein